MKLLTVLALLPLISSIPYSCSTPFAALGRHELVLVLPSAPAAWSCLTGLRMEVFWKSAGGELRSAFASPGSRQRIDVDRGVPQGILAYPVSGERRLLPAGALYPEALAVAGGERIEGADALVLDWPGGYAASIAAELRRGGLEPWAYDLSRLAAEAVGRCSDPWLIPCLEAARRLSSLEFRLDAYASPTRMTFVLPGPGQWAPESPFESAPVSSAGGRWVAMLSEGPWRFVSPQRELLAFVGADGSFRFVRRYTQVATRLLQSASLQSTPERR